MNQIQISPADVPPNARDRAAILSVIRTETEAFLAVDHARWANCWMHNQRTQVVYSSGNAGLYVIKGWSDISAHMQRVFEKDLVCRVVKIEPQEYQVNVQNDMAWVVYESIAQYPDGTTEVTYETRVLEQSNGGWKIAYASILQKREPGADHHEVGVDKNGQVICSSSESLELLKDHPDLTISAGRLRARRPVWDKILQEQIAKAGEYHGFFELARFTAEYGGMLKYPVVLGETEEGGVALVFITVRDCLTYVEVADVEKTDHRLMVAQAVFGLSDGQLRVASHIAAGLCLKKVSQELDISINTVRTHLTRIYEKTGVNTQTALVRLLLSVG